MKKTVLALLVAVLLLAALVVAVPGANATEATVHENHCVCGGTSVGARNHTCADVTWEPWPADNKWESGKHYYLTGDVTLSTTINVAPGTSLSICLNGHTLGSSTRLFSVESTLNLCDCDFEEAPEDSYADYIFKGTFTSSYVNSDTTYNYGPVFNTKHGANMNIFGGNFTSTGNLTNSGIGTVSTDPYFKTTAGDEKHQDKGLSVLNIYNGHFQGRSVTVNGGAISANHKNANLNIYGGVIEGGTAGSVGGNLNLGGTTHMYGGVISGGTANGDGGGNIRATGAFHLHGGLITGGSATKNGGSIYTTGALTINGGTIEKGVASLEGGNIWVSGVTHMYGGTISGGVANSATAGGGNVRATNTFYLHGGLVTGGYAVKDGGNFYQTGNNLWVYGGTITKGWCKGEGGNIRHGSWLHIDGGQITDGGCDPNGTVVTNKGGNIQSFTAVYHHGGTISGGKAKSNGGNISFWAGSKDGYIMEPKTENGGDGAPKVLNGEAPRGGNICFAGLAAYDGTNGFIHTIKGGTISGGKAEHGADINLSCAVNRLTISGGTFTGGKATVNGGSIAAEIPITVTGGTFTGSSAGETGGVMYLTGEGHSISGGTFSGSAKNAGCIYIGSGTLSMTGGTIENCKATNEGGGLYVGSSGKTTINGATIQNNTAGGGANVMCFGELEIKSGNILGGQTTGIGRGGNIYVFASTAKSPKLTITGGTISGGSTKGNGGTISLAANQNLTTNVVDATIENATIVAGASAGGNAICATNGVNLSIKNTTISSEATVGSSIHLWRESAHNKSSVNVTIGENVTFTGDGSANIYVQNNTGDKDFVKLDLSGITAPLTVKTSCFDRFATAPEAKLELVSAFFDSTEILHKDGQLYMTLKGGVAKVGQTGYGIFADAVAAADGQTVKLLCNDVTTELVLDSDLYLDLAGHTLVGTIDLNGNKLYGIDSATDNYTDEKAGTLAATLTGGEPETNVRCADLKRYIAVPGDSGYSFHRIYLSVKSVSFQPAKMGVGYKAIFAGSQTVKDYLDKENSFGVVLQLGTKPTELVEGCYAPFTDFTAGVAAGETSPNMKSILVQNIGLDYAETPIYGCAYLKLADGTLIMSNAVQPTLKEVVKLMDGKYASLTDDQKAVLDYFYTANEAAVKDWGLANIGKKEV